MFPVELQGARVKLRELRLDDLGDIFEYARDEEATRFMSWPTPEKPEDSLYFLRDMAIAGQSQLPRIDYELAIEVGSHVVGVCGLRINAHVKTEAELGYILHKKLWGQGLMPEAASLLLTFGFDTLGVHRIFAFHDVDNHASRRVMEKLGFQYEGRTRERSQSRASGEWRDDYLRSILATDPRPSA